LFQGIFFIWWKALFCTWSLAACWICAAGILWQVLASQLIQSVESLGEGWGESTALTSLCRFRATLLMCFIQRVFFLIFLFAIQTRRLLHRTYSKVLPSALFVVPGSSPVAS
jgi:hypothetical protein